MQLKYAGCLCPFVKWKCFNYIGSQSGMFFVACFGFASLGCCVFGMIVLFVVECTDSVLFCCGLLDRGWIIRDVVALSFGVSSSAYFTFH